MTQEKQHRQNNQLLNQRLSNEMTEQELIVFFKRAKIDLCCDIIDDEAKDAFVSYYGYLPLPLHNQNLWQLNKIG